MCYRLKLCPRGVSELKQTCLMSSLGPQWGTCRLIGQTLPLAQSFLAAGSWSSVTVPCTTHMKTRAAGPLLAAPSLSPNTEARRLARLSPWHQQISLIQSHLLLKTHYLLSKRMLNFDSVDLEGERKHSMLSYRIA